MQRISCLMQTVRVAIAAVLVAASNCEVPIASCNTNTSSIFYVTSALSFSALAAWINKLTKSSCAAVGRRQTPSGG